MPKFPFKQRKSPRLRGYDYTQEGLYFITICVQGRLHLFGEVINGVMHLNDAGRMIERWYHELENKYPDKICHDYVVMPDHFHCVIENTDGARNGDAHVGDAHVGDAHTGVPLAGRPNHNPTPESENESENEPTHNSPYGMHNKQFGASIPQAMDWFKTMTTNEYIRGVKQLGWKPFNRKLWQRSYHDRIIRDYMHYINVCHYIRKNPENWGRSSEGGGGPTSGGAPT
jgi:REP element-mobilizing transposase RayT